CLGHVRTNVAVADVTMEVRPGDEPGRLVPRTAQQQATPGRPESLRQFLKGPKPGGIKGGHVAKTQNHDRRKSVDVVEGRVELVCRTEQKRSMYPENSYIRRDGLILQRVQVTLLYILLRHRADGRRIGDTLDEQQGGAYHAHTHGLSKVGKHGQSERH